MAFEQTSLPYYSEFIHLSRYSRWIESLGRRETWGETVLRLVNFWENKFPEHVTPELAEILYDAIYDLEVMPSMRTMMTAGPALDRDNVAGYNPVVGDTLVLTKEYGVVPIESLTGKNLTVLNIDGNWTSATFKSYGEQDTFRVTCKLNSNTVNEVDCTANHRWVLKNGEVKKTENLSSGDRIKFVAAPKKVDTNSIDYKLGIIHGLIYGDGTATYSCERLKGYHIRLCSDSEELSKWFDKYPVAYPPSANGDPIYMLYDGFAKTHSLKELPSIYETDDYLIGFIRGWLAADGSVSKSSQVSICCNIYGKDWLINVAPTLGYVIQNEYILPSETNYGKRKSTSYRIGLSRSSLIKDDFIINRKKDRFRELDSYYVVASVEPTYKKEYVYCAEVPDTNTFVLNGGLVTGNCSYAACQGSGGTLDIMTPEMEEAGFDEPINIRLKEPKAFDEIMYILLCGTGVGFSVERQYIVNLPTVGKALNRNIYRRINRNYPGVLKDELSTFDKRNGIIHVADSKYGWASALRILITELYNGNFEIRWDTSKIRPKGSPLKTFGGRASGPEPLEELFRFCVELFSSAVSRKLTSVEVHSLVCKIASIVVVGGVRRSALISLSNLSDDRMRHAKSGDWWVTNPEFALANNSAVYTEKPDAETFIREWSALIESKSGERGIYNRASAQLAASKSGRRSEAFDYGVNPCSEIILRNQQFCNLSEVVARESDTFDDLKRKARYAAILGTLQATLTDFKYLNPEWKKNTEEEALLGVSITGIMDHPILNGTNTDIDYLMNEWNSEDLHGVLRQLKQVVIDTNKEWAEKLNINQATATTAVKPSGTVSQLVDSASGKHPRHNHYYLRSVRSDKKDPLSEAMIRMGFPYEEDITNPSNYVFYFPIKAPEGSLTRNDVTAIRQLELWKIYQENWCEHKPSITINVNDDEWMEVGAWVYKHFDSISGVSFLPQFHIYKQAPYQDLTEEEYYKLLDNMPKEVDWSILTEIENEDRTIGSQELACTGGSCEL